MARDHARVNVTIWQDAEFRALTPPAQHLYFVMWTHPDLSYCGVVDWRPGRLAALAGGWNREAVEAAAAELSAGRFIIIDGDTEEALLRSWVKWDGLLKQPRLSVSMAKAYASTYSETIRGVLTFELAKLYDRHPEFAAFKDDRIMSLLEQPVVDPADLLPFGEGFGGRFTQGFGDGFGPNATQGLGTPYSSSCSSSLTPAPSSYEEGPPAPKKPVPRKTRIPDDWAPNDSHRQKALEQGIDLDLEVEKFRDHAIANGKTFVDWGRGFHTWLNNAKRFEPRPGRPHHQPKTFDQIRHDANLDLWQQVKREEEGNAPWPPRALGA